MSKQKKVQAAILDFLDDIPSIEEEIKQNKSSASENDQANLNSIDSNNITASEINHETTNFKTIRIDTSECEPWDFADRDDTEMGNIEELVASIKSEGQQLPALIRPKKSPNGNVKYEVIFGHRRWLACKLANIRLLAMVKDISDKDAAVAQHAENTGREDISPYLLSKSYQKYLEKKTFSSERELAAHLGISKTTLNRVLSFTKIPKQLLDALKFPGKLPLRTAEKLAQICANISETDLDKVCAIAPDILTKRIPHDKVEAYIYAKLNNTYQSNKKEKKLFKNELGVKLFSSGLNQNKSQTLTFHKIVVDNNLVEDIENLVFEFLNKATKSK